MAARTGQRRSIARVADICVMGAGPGGLGAALLLAEDGHEVTVIERDEPPPGGDPEEIWRDWRRPGVPQARQIHAFFGRNRAILRAELPAVLDDLDRAGAVRLDYGAPAEDLVGIGARRTTLELVLRRRVEEHPRIDVLSRVAARGLQRAAPVIPGVPHVDGVRTTVGATVDADLVVDAAGRRSPLPRLLAELGALPPHDEAEADGFTYWTQWFRVTGTPPVDATLPFAHYDSFTAVRFTADVGWFAVCLTGAADDRVLRQLRDQGRFLAIAAVLPPTREWVDPDVATPQGGIVPMANILSRRRRLERAGKPCVTGLVSVGDAVACNNPMLGRGVALGLRHAQHLRDTLRDLAPDAPDFTAEYSRRLEPEVDAWYADTVGWDRSRLATMRQARGATGPPPPDLRAQFLHAAHYDATLYRAFLRILNAFEPAAQVFANPAVLARVNELLPDLPPPPRPPLDRAALEELLGGRRVHG